MLKSKRVMAGLASAFMMVAVIYSAGAGLTGSLSLTNPAVAQQEGNVPGNSLGAASDSEFWRAVRNGDQGTVSIPDKSAGIMVQSEGETWRNFRNGPLSTAGVWIILIVIAALAVFFAIRGRVRIESGFSGKTVERFGNLERFAHWLTGGTFIVLGLTGLNMLYGRYLFGGVADGSGEFGALHTTFAAILYYGKWAHNYLAFGFMAGLALILILWVRDNIPDRLDLKWLAVAGGLFSKGVHPPAKKFNAGQKVIFWIVILGGLSLSLSGLSLLFPFEFALFAKTYAVLNAFGFVLPTDLTAIEEMQLSQIWHSIIALVMTAVIIAHIYIGSLGMEGAFDAMGTGQVDENWAREHHSLWVAELKGETPPEDDGAAASKSKPDEAKKDDGATPQTA